MANDDAYTQGNRIQELVQRASAWTDEEISELRGLYNGYAVGGTIIRELAQMRATFELIAAIREFDKASDRAAQANLKLSKRVLLLGIITAAFALIQVLTS